MITWHEKEIAISEIKTLLEEGYEIEVDSPDGWVGINFFVDKGLHEEYILRFVDDSEPIRCNAGHLFETANGWVSARDLSEMNSTRDHIIHFNDLFLCREGYVRGYVAKTGNIIPIVDINVNHPNHRYYTGTVSSHNTGVGKSLAMCSFASGNLLDGKNVLYITLEMAEERIAERIDANLLDVTMDDLGMMSKEIYDKKIDKVKSKTTGKLIVKEYPTSSAGSANFRHLINELKLKKNFKPDIIYVDYLNICASSRMKYTANMNSYTYVKAIAEELRGLAVEFNVPIVSATQTTRSGFGNSDVGLEDTSESFGLPATADFMFALITSEELEGLNQLMVKQLKNRYNDLASHRRFVVGVDRSKMKLYDVDQSEQNLIDEDKPLMDKTTFGSQDEERNKPRSKFRKKFEGFE
jgi:hypothetical protein